MPGKAAKVMLTEKQQSILQQIHRSKTAPQRLVQRVCIILQAFAVPSKTFSAMPQAKVQPVRSAPSK